MMNFGNIGLANTFLPLAGLVVLALVLPLVTVPRATRSQARLGLGIVAAAGLTFVAALALFAGLHAGAGNGLRWGAVLRPAGLSALAWGPLLALAWLVRAQGVERRRGQDMARSG
jgi:hypothetical protein